MPIFAKLWFKTGMLSLTSNSSSTSGTSTGTSGDFPFISWSISAGFACFDVLQAFFDPQGEYILVRQQGSWFVNIRECIRSSGGSDEDDGWLQVLTVLYIHASCTDVKVPGRIVFDQHAFDFVYISTL